MRPAFGPFVAAHLRLSAAPRFSAPAKLDGPGPGALARRRSVAPGSACACSSAIPPRPPRRSSLRSPSAILSLRPCPPPALGRRLRARAAPPRRLDPLRLLLVLLPLFLRGLAGCRLTPRAIQLLRGIVASSAFDRSGFDVLRTRRPSAWRPSTFEPVPSAPTRRRPCRPARPASGGRRSVLRRAPRGRRRGGPNARPPTRRRACGRLRSGRPSSGARRRPPPRSESSSLPPSQPGRFTTRLPAPVLRYALVRSRSLFPVPVGVAAPSGAAQRTL